MNIRSLKVKTRSTLTSASTFETQHPLSGRVNPTWAPLSNATPYAEQGGDSTVAEWSATAAFADP
jgi:hypothetical protein